MPEKPKKGLVPAVAINNVPLTAPIPLTTEEPVRRPWLKTELEDMNNDTEKHEEDANIADEDDDDTDESSESDEDSLTGQNKIKNIESQDDEEEEHEEFVESKYKGSDIMAFLSREMSDYQERQDDETAAYERQVALAQTEEDLMEADPELLRRTESNRHIPYNEQTPTRTKRSNTIHGQSDMIQRDLLVFSDNPTVIEEATKLSVIQYYGAGKSGIMPAAYRSKRKTKAYLVACDFSKESLYAIEWTMGTMMRDGDELHLATVANRDDNPDVVKATGLDQKGEVTLHNKIINNSQCSLLFFSLVACYFRCSYCRSKETFGANDAV
jgi:hypothetical protein